MNIQGLLKLSLLDYPGTVACTLFTGGCNFRCPFCHNASLVLPEQFTEPISENDFFSFLKKRKSVIDGVCISGGEPLMQKDILSFISEIKKIGYKIKLDTNGSFPEKLKELVCDGLIDYVAMDIKNSPEKYSVTAGYNTLDFSSINESINFLLSGKIPYEFRTTAVRELHNEESFKGIAKLISGAENYFIQNFVDSGNLIKSGYSGFTPQELSSFAEIVRPTVKNISLRGL